MKTQPSPSTACSPIVRPRDGFVLVLDVGTTGIKAFVFDGSCRMLAKAYRAIGKRRPRAGWVEQDPRELVTASRRVLREAVAASGIPADAILGVGITNQREATVLWDARTGKPAYPVIGWEDARTAAACRALRRTNGRRVQSLTGLPIDAYFSASKIRWALDRVPAAKRLANEGRIAFGTIDAWLLFNLCAERPRVTDETNAARTLLYNIRTRSWDGELLAVFGVPADVLPVVLPSRSRFGTLAPSVLGHAIPVVAVCGDQQSSAYACARVARAGARPTKVTYGTGSFVVQTVGRTFVTRPGFVTTLVPGRRGSVFALEAKVEGSGEAVASRLDDPAALARYLKSLAKKISAVIARLPYRPSRVVADGGAARDGIVVGFQRDASGIPTCLLEPYDGTALGTALLAWDALAPRRG